jgi:hypothetical protein
MEEKMTEKKPIWEEPELIVIVRGSAQEAVLVSCKSGYTKGAGENWGNCVQSHPSCLGACESISDS